MVRHAEELSATREARSAESVRTTYALRGDAADHVVPPAVWVLFTMIWLLFLFYPIQESLQAHLSPVHLSVAIAGMMSFVGIYLWLMLHDPFRDTPSSAKEVGTSALLIVVLCGIVLFLTLAYSINWLWFVMYANMSAAVKLPVRVAAPIITGLTILTVIVGGITADWTIASRIVSPVAAVAVLMIGISQLVVTIRELRAARQEIARLAVTEAVVEERLRFARDLHDLLGHSLSAITLKNELARRIITTQPDRAVQEIDDAIATAREALREVREAVAGYRQPTLAAELASAREILEAARIDCQSEDVGGMLPPAVESVLAWAVREGVTNVVRHSGARHCTIRVVRTTGTVTAEITDDGRGSAPSRAVGAMERSGYGLSGLAERAARQGGSVETGTSDTSGFRLSLTLPLDDDCHPDGTGGRSE